jgi:hypothetical protein
MEVQILPAVGPPQRGRDLSRHLRDRHILDRITRPGHGVRKVQGGWLRARRGRPGRRILPSASDDTNENHKW